MFHLSRWISIIIKHYILWMSRSPNWQPCTEWRCGPPPGPPAGIWCHHWQVHIHRGASQGGSISVLHSQVLALIAGLNTDYIGSVQCLRTTTKYNHLKEQFITDFENTYINITALLCQCLDFKNAFVFVIVVTNKDTSPPLVMGSQVTYFSLTYWLLWLFMQWTYPVLLDQWHHPLDQICTVTITNQLSFF